MRKIVEKKLPGTDSLELAKPGQLHAKSSSLGDQMPGPSTYPEILFLSLGLEGADSTAAHGRPRRKESLFAIISPRLAHLLLPS